MKAAPGAYVFDLYGTLVDIASLRERAELPAGRAVAFVEAWRAKQLLYAFTATLMERYLDFDAITALALDYTAAQFDFELAPAERAGLLEAWSRLPAYPEVPATLAALRERGFALAVLSNGTPHSLARTLERANVAGSFAAVLSVDAVRAFKPHPHVYRSAVERLGLPRERIGFVSSNGWDATGAAEFGFRVVWCNRAGLPAETMGTRPERTIANLTELLDG
ncbi:MAG: haloacid dehalogenase type II [Candidatus Baltobacteraceae bacterium]